jgi:cysteinyl-tRNA synthetase
MTFVILINLAVEYFCTVLRMKLIMESSKNSIEERDIQINSWNKLYYSTKNWNEDFKFYKQDLKFLQELIDTFFEKLVLIENLDELRETQMDLLRSRDKCSILRKQIKGHLSQLSVLIEDRYKYDATSFTTEHQQLEENISKFIKEMRNMRKNTFIIAKDALKESPMKLSENQEN